MKTIIYLMIVICSIGLVLAPDPLQSLFRKKETSDQIYKRLLLTNDKFTPGEVLTTLRLLEKLLEPNTTKEGIEQLTHVKDLLSVADLTLEKCDLQRFDKYETIWKRTKNFDVAMYLEDWRYKQYVFCEDIFKEQFKADLAKLSPKVKEEFYMLLKYIEKAAFAKTPKNLKHSIHWYISIDDVAKGALAYMKGKTSTISAISNSEEWFDNTVGALCNTVLGVMGPWRDTFIQITSGGNKKHKLDKNLEEWVENAQVCAKVIGSKEDIARNAQDDDTKAQKNVLKNA